MTAARESDEPSIVVVGKFDPREFHPAELALRGLLPAEDAEGAKLQGESFFMEYTTPWLMVQVFPGRFLARANDALHLTALSDLVFGALKNLSSANVSAVGLNRLLRYRLGDAAAWHALGDQLVPKPRWSAAGLLPEAPEREHPGLTVVQVQGRRPESTSTHLRALIRPEPELRVVVDLNEHFETDLAGSLKIIREQWDDAQQFFNVFADHLIGAG